jgi:phosphoribosylformylglycinamidine synthase
MNYRIFTEKLPEFRSEAQNLMSELNHALALSIKELRIINVYDVFGISEELCKMAQYRVFGDIVTDNVTMTTGGIPCDTADCSYLAMEYLPGQYDQRAAAAADCVRLLQPSADAAIRSARMLVFDKSMAASDLERIKGYLVNPVEMREKDMTILKNTQQAQVNPVSILEGFLDMAQDTLDEYCKNNGLAMNAADLQCVIDYYKKHGRNPTLTELRILDTYWSDHCRHTTFNTKITDLYAEKHFAHTEINDTFWLYLRLKREAGVPREEMTLMNLATIGARWLKCQNMADEWEDSEEKNACCIPVNVDVGGAKNERWLLLFKNETHNHPTEIEPYGGASTCLGGAIRDPLSGRAYVYQAMRVSGAGNIYAHVDQTMHGKLPQRVISTKAAHGYSAYGNQIGVATTHVREIYHPNYVAKRMEVGAVVGAVRAIDMKRERPAAGDLIFLIGGATGRDGIGGATGSSKKHTITQLETCGSEVQKGNATEERKLQRLLRRPEVTRIIKKCNDFGAGGIAVAIGELSDGVDIYLDRMPVKYDGLNHMELAISESQERMAVVIPVRSAERFREYCQQENIVAAHVADVVSEKRMRMFYHGQLVADIERSFIDSAGAPRTAKASLPILKECNPFERIVQGNTLKEKILANLADNNVLCQKGLSEMFDATIGCTTVLMPFGGETQRTESQVSAHKIPPPLRL